MSYSQDLSQINLDNLPMFKPLNNTAFVPESIITGSFLQAQDQNNYEPAYMKDKQLRDFSVKPASGNHEANSYDVELTRIRKQR